MSTSAYPGPDITPWWHGQLRLAARRAGHESHLIGTDPAAPDGPDGPWTPKCSCGLRGKEGDGWHILQIGAAQLETEQVIPTGGSQTVLRLLCGGFRGTPADLTTVTAALLRLPRPQAV